jgi:hypothetical protein
MYVEDLLHPLFDTPLAPMPAWLRDRVMAKASQNGHGLTEPRDWAALLGGAPEGERGGVACQVAGLYRRERGPAREDVSKSCWASRLVYATFPDDECG